MTETQFPTVPAGVMPLNWEDTPAGLRIAISPIDDFGLPFAKRGFATAIPRGEAETLKFADEVAKSVRNTIIFLLTGKEPE